MKLNTLREQFQRENERLKRELAATKEELAAAKLKLGNAEVQLADLKSRYNTHKANAVRHTLLTQPGVNE